MPDATQLIIKQLRLASFSYLLTRYQIIPLLVLFCLPVEVILNACPPYQCSTADYTMHQKQSQFACASYFHADASLTNLTSIYQTIDKIASYRVEIQSQFQISISRSINESSDAEDTTGIDVGYRAEKDIWLSFNADLVIIECNVAWTVKIGCGTYIEVHLPYHPQLLKQVKIEEIGSPINLSINGLCAGTYHLWFIYSTRIGKVIKTVRSIFISEPACTCS